MNNAVINGFPIFYFLFDDNGNIWSFRLADMFVVG